MSTRRLFLAAAPALLAFGGTALATVGGLPRGLRDPVLGDIPICRGGATRVQYMQGRESNDPAAADAALLEALGLMEGHMLIGRALVDAGEARLGLPHFGHPVSELYTWLEPRIAARGARPFEAELITLEARAKDGAKGADLATVFEPALAGVAALRATVAPERAASQKFRMEHVATMLGAVADDYGESIERGRIANVPEYHDSAGFLRYAIATATKWGAEPGAPAVWGSALSELEAVRRSAYPELLPPPRPPVSISAIRARSAKVNSFAEQI